MAKPFSIQNYLSKNSWKTGEVKKEVGDTPFKGGNNDIRKTNYDVNIKDGKLDLHTHKTVLTESTINEDNTFEKLTGDIHKNLIDMMKYVAKTDKRLAKELHDTIFQKYVDWDEKFSLGESKINKL